MSNSNAYRQMEMFKAPSKMTKKEIRSWLFEHAEIYSKLKNLKGYTILFTLEDSPFGPPVFDCYAESWFSCFDDLVNSFNDAITEKSLKHVKSSDFYDPDLYKVVWAEENIISFQGAPNRIPDKDGMYRQMGMIKTPPHMTKQELIDWWFEHARRYKILDGLRWYTILFTIEDTPFGYPPFDGYAEIWFDNLNELKKAFKNDVEQDSLKHVQEYGLFDPKYHHAVWSEEFIIKKE